ncbi:MAG TPA: DUF177 domain-containing protein [Patescibacteria group bacterium]|nr:DUF177 domain-containing protein [Patescibacteria group bacterium]
MEIDLGSVKDRWNFTFHGIFGVPDQDGNERCFHATVNGMVTRMGSRLLLRAAISGTVRLECSACIEAFDMPLQTELTIVFHHGQVPHDVDEDDLVPLTEADEGGYDILPRVREVVILEFPIRCLCREDCKGLCPRCGSNLNHGPCTCIQREDDPRWAQLKKLLNNGEKR